MANIILSDRFSKRVIERAGSYGKNLTLDFLARAIHYFLETENLIETNKAMEADGYISSRGKLLYFLIDKLNKEFHAVPSEIVNLKNSISQYKASMHNLASNLAYYNFQEACAKTKEIEDSLAKAYEFVTNLYAKLRALKSEIEDKYTKALTLLKNIELLKFHFGNTKEIKEKIEKLEQELVVLICDIEKGIDDECATGLVRHIVTTEDFFKSQQADVIEQDLATFEDLIKTASEVPKTDEKLPVSLWDTTDEDNEDAKLIVIDESNEAQTGDGGMTEGIDYFGDDDNDILF